MIEVELPDGTILEFPEGTTQDVMRAAIAKLPNANPGNGAADRIAAAKAGTLSVADPARQAEIDAMAGVEAPRGMGAAIYDNLIGADDGVQSYGEGLGTWLNRAGESMTLGLAGDEASAGLYSMLPGRDYEGELARFRGNEEAMSTAGQISADVAGALIPGIAGLGLVSGARGLGGAVMRGAGLGAGAGATMGFMEGEGGLANRTVGAGLGGLIGGAMGGAIPVAGAGLQRGARAVSDWRRAGNVGGSIGKALGISDDAGRVIGDFLTPESPDALRAAMTKAGPDAMLADAGPMTGGMLDAAMRSPTPGARLAGERVTARAGAAGDDIVDALAGGVQGPRMGVGGAMDAIRKGTAGARSSAYDAAYSKPIDYSAPAGGKLLDEISPRIPSEAISYANRLMKINGEQSAQIMASIGDDGVVTFTSPPDVRQWDYIKQALDGLAESGDGAGALGGQTRMGAAYQSLAKQIRDSVAQLVPEYRTALDTASDAITRRNAVKFGADLLSPRITTEEALGEIATATGGQKAAMRDGVRAQIDEVLGNVRAVGSDQNIDAREAVKAFTDLSSVNAQRKLEALFGDQWPAIKESLDRAGAAIGLRARTAANSATNQRGVFQEAIKDAVTPGPVRRGQVIPATRDAWARLTGASPEAIKRMGLDVQSEIADVLTRQGMGGQAIDAVVAALSANPINMAAGKTSRGVLEALLLGNIGRTTDAATDRLTGRTN